LESDCLFGNCNCSLKPLWSIGVESHYRFSGFHVVAELSMQFDTGSKLNLIFFALSSGSEPPGRDAD
jgi:hypothetical protein